MPRFALLIVLSLGLLCAGCVPAARVASPVAASTPAVSAPATGPASAPGGESPQQAAARLFDEVYAGLLSPGTTEHPDAVRGARAGAPVPVSKDYFMTSRLLASWTLDARDDDAWSNMFDAMRPSEMSTDSFIVAVMKDGVSASEFDVNLDESGRWQTGSVLNDPLPGGQVYSLQDASKQLVELLGPGTFVRPVLFLPAGLEFAVGRNGDREAAVYLTFVNHGPDVGSFNQYLPEDGTMYTTSELRKLLSR